MYRTITTDIKKLLHRGTVIPAHPLALNQDLSLDEKTQRLLTRYYIESGAGGVAVGVHTTQFEIRAPQHQMLDDVLRIAADEITRNRLNAPFIKIAGICGPTEQAVKESETALKYGYHLGLLSMGGLKDWSEEALIERAKTVAEKIPLFGFYLQPAVGGRYLSFKFWSEFVKIPNVYAIKVAAFNRYQTLDVVRALCLSDRRDDIALYTGNDDNIITDLLTPYKLRIEGKVEEKRFVGGLLGHWSVWTSKAVQLLREIKHCIDNEYKGIETLLEKNIHVTDMNAAIFDAPNSYKGSIAGIHAVLQRQGLMKNVICLNPAERLSPGQSEEIERVCNDYPELTDDHFVQHFLKSV